MHQKIYPRRINAKEVLISQKGDEFKFPYADGSATLSGRDYQFGETTQRPEQTVRSEGLSGELHGEPEENQEMTLNPAEIFGLIQGDFIYRHHIEPRVQIFVPEETFPISLKYIDVMRSTHTDLDVIQEKRINDYWKVDENRRVSDYWKEFIYHRG